ncbi:T9SS type A sorting domain-containing protein [Soonwooa sp.]|uniref:T9SS type A sorting domain-containing protein n=1 Tax=Soonwooa sp. TaxID=1938592 RepID=UPI0039182D80
MNSISVYDLNGRSVLTEKLKSKSNLSKLARGLYILKIETKDFNNQEIKFIKN